MFLETIEARGPTPVAPETVARTIAQVRSRAPARRGGFGVDSEYGVLESVLLADPRHLALVPCNSLSEEAARGGHRTCVHRAARQHAGLVAALEGEGVEVRLIPADTGLPDLAFTRDAGLMTPWGLVGLRPGAAHRTGEVELVLEAARVAGLPVLGRIESGRIEGGDVAIIRPGLLLIGISGTRTDEAGAAALARLFRGKGWQVVTYRFDPYFLHLDTLFCMVDNGLAMACADVLDECLLGRLDSWGVEPIPVAYKEARRLGCNLLSLGDRRVITAGTCSRIDVELACRGYRAIAVDLGEFTACGGGVHCLTMPLRREPG